MTRGNNTHSFTVTMLPYDPQGYFQCQYGYSQMSNITGGLKDVEACKTWCFIREDHISQSL